MSVSKTKKGEKMFTNLQTFQKEFYQATLLLSSNKKTINSASRVLNIDKDKIRRNLLNPVKNMSELVKIINKLFAKQLIYLIIDDTLISKKYSSKIEGSSDNYDSADKTYYRSLCSVTAMATNGKIGIPLDHEFWTSKEFTTEEFYKTKIELAQRLISRLNNVIELKAVLADGLYNSFEMIEWLKNNRINFEMRIHSNRKIKYNGQYDQIKNIIKLKGKNHKCTITADWKGSMIFITAFRRFKKNGSSVIVYQASNFKSPARDHVRIYGYRWNIEKFFRTAKQYLGLKDCQSRKIEIQDSHIKNIFSIYAFLQIERKKRKLSTPEQAYHALKQKFTSNIHGCISRIEQNLQEILSVHA